MISFYRVVLTSPFQFHSSFQSSFQFHSSFQSSFQFHSSFQSSFQFHSSFQSLCVRFFCKSLTSLRKVSPLIGFKTTKFLFLTTLFFIWPLIPAIADDKSSNKICFFEMDNTTTGDNFRSRFKNGDRSANIYVREVEDGEDAKKAFEDMISQSGGCQGLVISGHHSGDWFSKEGDNILYLKELERLACDPAHKEWFSNIQGLWLDGSFTVTDDKVSDELNPDTKTLNQLEHDIIDKENLLHGRMVDTYQQSYAGSLSKHTPLSSRYLRMFPKTQIFGFAGLAPRGAAPQQVGSRSFAAEQILMTVDSLNAEDAKNKDNKVTENRLSSFFSSIDTDNCGEKWNSVSAQATASIANKDHKEASRLGCELILAKQQLEDNNPNNDGAAKTQLLNALQEINDSDNNELVDLLFNNIYDSLQLAERLENDNFLDKVKDALRNNRFTNSLTKRITSPHTASLRKGDYIYLYKKLHDGEITGDMQTAINTLIGKATSLFEDTPLIESPNKPEASEEVKRALAASVVDQLTQYDLLTDQQIIKLRSETRGTPPTPDLFSEDALNNNPFIADVYTRLHLTVKDEGVPSRPNTEAIIDGLQTAGGGEEYLRSSRIRVGAQMLFSSKDGRPDLKNLRKMTSQLEPGRTDDIPFFIALSRELRGKTTDQKVKFLTEISKGTRRSLPRLVFKYSRNNLSAEEKSKFCANITDSRDHERYISDLRCNGNN